MTEALREAVSPLGALVPIGPVRRAPRLPGRALMLRLANDRLRRAPRSFDVAETSVGRVVSGNTSDLIERYLYVFGTWEPSLSAFLRSKLGPGDVFVDVGANVGYFTLLAADAVSQTGHVIAFEPHPATVEKLRGNIDANGLRNVTVIPSVASDTAGEVELFSGPATNLGRSSTAPVPDGTAAGRVASVVAADAVPHELWPRVRAIKVDVEGDELRVLRGLHRLLEALPTGACVVVEVAPERLEERGESASVLFDTMVDLGFTAASLPNDYHPSSYARRSVARPTPLTAPPSTIVDVVFTKS